MTFHCRLANFAKSGLSCTEVPTPLTSPHSQKDHLCPLLPQNPNDIEKILHCSICQCIGVYPASCPADKQMYILMCPSMEMSCPVDTDCQNRQVVLSSYLHLSPSCYNILCHCPFLAWGACWNYSESASSQRKPQIPLPEYGTQSYFISFEKPRGAEWL